VEFAALIGSVEFGIAAVIGSVEFGICSCHWLCRIWNLQLSLALENLEFAAVIGSVKL